MPYLRGLTLDVRDDPELDKSDLNSLCGWPRAVSPSMRVVMHLVLPTCHWLIVSLETFYWSEYLTPLGPSTIMPCLTLWVSYSWIILTAQEGWYTCDWWIIRMEAFYWSHYLTSPASPRISLRWYSSSL